MPHAIANPIQPTPASRHRFHLLDALRGVASATVVYWHAPRYISRGGHSSFLAVDFFFCLSGFVVAFAYEKRLQAQLGFRAFITARLIRLYPVFLLAAVLGVPVFLLTQVAHPIPVHLYSHLALLISAQLLLLPNIHLFPAAALFPVLDPGWSLFFELLANIAFGLMIRLRRGSSALLLILCAVALAAMAFSLRTHHSLDIGSTSSMKSIFGGVARVGLSFTAGVLTQRFYRRMAERALTPAVSAALSILLTGALLFFILTPFAFMHSLTYQLALAAVGFPLLVFLGAFCRVPTSWNKLCAFLGDVSYPLYLFHYPVCALIALPYFVNLVETHPSFLPFVIPALLCVIGAFSYAVQIVYDIPVRKFLSRRFSASLSRPSHSSSITATEKLL